MPLASIPPLTVLQLFIGSVPGGVLKYVVELSAAMERAGVRMILAGQRGGWHELVEQAGLRWEEIPIAGGPVDLWRSAGRVGRLVRQEKVNVIHAHHRRATLAARLAQRLSPFYRSWPALLYTLHLTGMPMGLALRVLTDFGDITHVPSQAAGRWLLEQGKVAKEDIRLIPHGIDPAKFPLTTIELRAAARRELGLAADRPVALFVGRLEDPKNEGWILDLAGRTRASLPEWLFVLAGDGPNRAALERRIEAENLSGRVKLIGQVSPPGMYHAAEALLLPSAREGFAYVCAEAMSCGVAVLRTRTAGTEEMIVPGITGRACDIDREAFLAAAEAMLGDRAGLTSMGAAAADFVRQNLSFERQVEATLQLYRRLAAQ